MLIKGNFAQLEGLAAQIASTVARVEQEMDTWRTTAGATSADWLDQAGGQFSEISAAWHETRVYREFCHSASSRCDVPRAYRELRDSPAVIGERSDVCAASTSLLPRSARRVTSGSV